MNKMWQYLEATIADARKLPKWLYQPEAREWHTGLKICKLEKCKICLGGVALAKPLNLFRKQENLEYSNEVRALNWLRIGDTNFAYAYFYDKAPSHVLTHFNPAFPNFVGWTEFNAHLDWLEENMLPYLKELDI